MTKCDIYKFRTPVFFFPATNLGVSVTASQQRSSWPIKLVSWLARWEVCVQHTLQADTMWLVMMRLVKRLADG